MINLNYSLLNADVFSYYPAPKFWFTWKRGREPRRKIWSNIIGFQFRFWKFGLTCHFGPGKYAYRLKEKSNGDFYSPWYRFIQQNNYGPIKWYVYIYDYYDEWLENCGF